MLRHCMRELSMRQHATGLDAILIDFDPNQFNCMMMMMKKVMMVMMMKFFIFCTDLVAHQSCNDEPT